jgi:5-methylcytosine-specific restriction endonuclease McrA
MRRQANRYALRQAGVTVLGGVTALAFIAGGWDYGVTMTILSGMLVLEAARGWPGVRRHRLRHEIRYWNRHGRPPTPSGLRLQVFRRDGFRCVACGRRRWLQADHIRPWHYGGQTTLANLATLCVVCNRIKSDYWPMHGYHPWPRYNHKGAARKILAAEQHHMAKLRQAA